MEPKTLSKSMRWAAVGALILVISACSKPMPDYETLARSVSEAPYFQTVDNEPYRLTLKQQPAWVLAGDELIKLKKEGGLNLESVETALKTYDGAASFVLKIGPHPSLPRVDWPKTDIVNHHPNLPSFSSNLHHLIYGLDNRIYLLTEDKTKVPVSLYQLDRNWGLTTSNRFLITFPMKSSDWDLTKDKEIEVVFQTLHPLLPEVRFKYPINPLKHGNYTSGQILESLQNWTLESTTSDKTTNNSN